MKRRGLLAAETKLAQNAKKIALMVLGTAAQKYMMGLGDQQEVLMNCADIIMDAYQMETAILRAKKSAERTATDAAADTNATWLPYIATTLYSESK